MELTDRLSTLHPQDQIKIMERVFRKLALAFGNQLLSKWQGMKMIEVYEDWAEALQNYSIGAIEYGIEASKAEQHPPSQGEFIANCKRWRGQEGVKRLEHKLTPEQLENNRAKVAELVAKFSRRATGGSDPAKEA